MGVNPFHVIREDETYESFNSQLMQYQEELVNKWEWLLDGHEEGLKALDKKIWPWMAMVFENQQASSRSLLTEATKTTDMVFPEKYSLPIIRQVFPALLATKICSIQPLPLMSGGTGKIFWLDTLYDAGLGGDDSKVDVMPPDSDYSQYTADMENKVPKGLKLSMTSDTITAKKNILGATWSTEVQEDARGVLGIDVQSELVNACAAQILREIDYRLLMLIWNGAGAGDTNWYWALPEGCECRPKEHYETLGHAVIDASDDIYGSLYTEADFIIAGRTVAKYIAKMSDFIPNPEAVHPTEGSAFSGGTRLIGTLQGFWDIYKSPLLGTNHAIVGSYPQGMVRCGAIFSPYIPLTTMPLVYAEYIYNEGEDPGEGTPVHGAYLNTDKWTRNVRERSAMKMVVPTNYARIYIAESA